MQEKMFPLEKRKHLT